MRLADLFESQNDITVILKNEHREVAGLFKSLRAMADSDIRQTLSLYAELRESLHSHLHAEEAVLYRLMQSVNGLKIDGFEGAQEHALMYELIRKLDNYSPADRDLWKASIKVLNELVNHHVDEEENIVFPKIKKLFTIAQREKMGVEFLRRQTEILEGKMLNLSVFSAARKNGYSPSLKT